MKTRLSIPLFVSLVSLWAFTRKPTGVKSTPTNKTASNKAVVSTYFNEVINRQRVDLVRDVFTDDVQLVNGKESGHLQATEAFLAVLFRAFPDMTYILDEIVTEGDTVVVRATAKATHKGEFLGYEPLGNKVDIGEIFFFTMENGKIKHYEGFPDMFNFDKQLTENK